MPKAKKKNYEVLAVNAPKKKPKKRKSKSKKDILFSNETLVNGISSAVAMLAGTILGKQLDKTPGKGGLKGDWSTAQYLSQLGGGIGVGLLGRNFGASKEFEAAAYQGSIGYVLYRLIAEELGDYSETVQTWFGDDWDKAQLGDFYANSPGETMYQLGDDGWNQVGSVGNEPDDLDMEAIAELEEKSEFVGDLGALHMKDKFVGDDDDDLDFSEELLEMGQSLDEEDSLKLRIV